MKRSVGNPAIESAATRADGPGIATTSQPDLAASATSSSPGSLRSGVPASLTSATDAPASRRCMIAGVR